MKSMRAHGFTLIELLTVIAIIGILSAMVFTVYPRVMEKSKIASLMNTCNQVRTKCVAYAAKSKTGSFPPMYGYKILGKDPAEFSLKPYVADINLFREIGVYDPFALDSHDTDRDGRLSRLEFCPVGTKTGPDTYQWSVDLYDETNLPDEVDSQLSEQRPLVYIPVNTEQARLVAQYYWTVANDLGRPDEGWYATCWLPDEAMPDGEVNPLTKLTFPPTKYDDFVLISVGPSMNTGGILTAPVSFMDDLAELPLEQQQENVYHILALRAYFLATRDMDDNGLLDFDYRNRQRGKEEHALPDGTRLQGPIIYRQGSSS